MDRLRLIGSLVFPTLLLIVAALGLIPSTTTATWYVSVVATEFGHWMAIPALISMAWFGNKWSQDIIGARRGLATSTVAFCIFISPFIRASVMQKDLREQLTAFGPLPVTSRGLMRFASLWKLPPPELESSNFVYRDDVQPAQSLEFYAPVDAKEPAPWVLVIHGGGWVGGNARQLSSLNTRLAKLGYGVVSINYRLAPEAKWPAPLDDAKKAVEFVRAHAKEWNLNPAIWAVLGRSAGGQIAGVLAYTADLKPKGFIALYTPSDLIFGYDNSAEDDIVKSRQILRAYLGGTPTEKTHEYAAASPLNVVTAQAPPTLVIHGAADTLVWVRHSERLETRLNELKVPVAFLRLPWATHGFDVNLATPSGQLSTSAIEIFLAQIFP